MRGAGRDLGRGHLPRYFLRASYPGLDHDPTMAQSTPDLLAWVRDRFAGKPSADHCADVPPT